MIDQLKTARRTLEKYGWVGPDREPWCRDSAGRKVRHDDEGVMYFSVCGALQLAGLDVDRAFELLGRVTSSSTARLELFMAENSFAHVQTLALEDAEAYLALEEQWYNLQRAADGEFLTFGGWLCQTERTAADVLKVFTTLLLKLKREMSA